MSGVCSTHGEDEKAYKSLVGKPEGKKPLGRPRRRWENIIKKDLREIGFENICWIHQARDRDI
jgi:hypothetical protein